MKEIIGETEYIVTGNPIKPEKGQLYIKRSADEELLKKCLAESSVLLLGPPRVGKSSMINTAIETLEERGYLAVKKVFLATKRLSEKYKSGAITEEEAESKFYETLLIEIGIEFEKKGLEIKKTEIEKDYKNKINNNTYPSDYYCDFFLQYHKSIINKARKKICGFF